MIPVPLIVLLSASGGTLFGCALRQPEINKLKRQIKDLQKDNSRVKKLMYEQQKLLEELMLDYSKLKFYQIIDKRKEKQNIRGQILLGYEYKEYVDLLIRAEKGRGIEGLSEIEQKFLELCTEMIEGRKIEEQNLKAMDKYIMKKYKKEIFYMKDANIVDYIEKVV